ncbi:hypothetical protein K7432_011379 [Basidiobolus ranarum]|uniref:Uncharacterized protein n=1 Tax=Basidiobolus ranarum TaxID=34480 RepID=A0ABR2VUS2_9FUNG
MTRQTPTYKVTFSSLNEDEDEPFLSTGTPFILIPLVRDKKPLIRRLDVFDDESEIVDICSGKEAMNSNIPHPSINEKRKRIPLQAPNLPSKNQEKRSTLQEKCHKAKRYLPLRVLSRNSIFETQRRFGAFDDIRKIPNYIESVDSINFVWKQSKGMAKIYPHE